eukprot:jgi/Tetstr1/462958/TSEL_007906.t1
MPGSGSPTAPKMVDAGKAAAVGGIGKTAIEQDPIEAAHRKAEDTRLNQLIQEQLSRLFTTQDTPMSPAAAGEEDASLGGNESRAGGQDQNVRREAVAPRATFAKDATENSGKSKAKVEPPSVDKPNDEVLRRADPMEMRCEDTPLSAPSK